MDGEIKAQCLPPFSIYHFTFSMLYSVLDMEMIEFPGRGKRVELDILDVLIHAMADAVDDLLHLLRGAFHEQFDSTVREVTHKPEDIMAQGDVFHGIPEADTLNAAGEMTMNALNG
jgi:hypothetical protein